MGARHRRRMAASGARRIIVTAASAHRRGLALLAPAVVLTLVVVMAGVGSLVLASLGLLPLFGPANLTTQGFMSATPNLWLSVRESLVIAASSTAIALVVGLTAALLLLRAAPRRRWLAATVATVLPVPHLVGAAAMGLLLSGGGVLSRLLRVEQDAWPELVGGPWPVATVLEFAWKESAFVAVVVLASTSAALPDLTDAARMLGAGARQRLLRVTLPLAAPAAAASSLIVFLYSFGAYEVAWLLGRAYPEPLPAMAYRLYTSIDLAARPQAAATALTAITVSVLAAAATVPVLRRLGAAR